MIALGAAQTLEGSAGTASAITYTVTGSSTLLNVTSYEVLAQGQLGTTVAPMLTVAAGASALISHILLSNTSSGAVTVSLFVDGGAGSNQIVNLAIPANGSASFDRDGWKTHDSSGALQFVGATGPTGVAGTRGSLWYEGAGAPGTITGQLNNDLYLNTSTDDLYQLVAGTWTLLTNIKGATGATGATGPTGATGATGATGTRGSLWYEGAGAPGTIAGQLNNDFYLNTSTDDVYQLIAGTWTLLVNIKGATGATGATGPAGPQGAPGAALVTANEVQLTTTGATTVMSYTPTTAATFLLGLYFRVATATTAVTAVVNYTSVSGAQTLTLLSAVNEAVGDYTFTGFEIDSVANSPIYVIFTAGTANNVYVSGFIAAGGGAIGATGPAGSPLYPTAIKTTAYAAAALDLVVCNPSATFSVTLPTSPPNGTMVGIEVISSATSTVTLTPGGSNTIRESSLALSAGQQVLLVYGSTAAEWETVVKNTGLSGTVPIASGGTGQTTASAALSALGGVPLSTVTTAGDLIVGTGPSAVSRLGVGSNGQVLEVVSGSPAWTTPSAGALSNSNVTFTTPIISLPANTTTTFLTSPSLAIGTWLVVGGAAYVPAATVTTEVDVYTYITMGTAIGSTSVTTFFLNFPYNSGSYSTGATWVPITSIVTISAAGTILLQANPSAAAYAQGHSNLQFVKIA